MNETERQTLAGERVCSRVSLGPDDGPPRAIVADYYNPNLLFVIKDFSDWPTIPQLYVNGELLGGHDIVNAMHEAGELKAELGA